ncbi:cytochrome P450 [Saccharothrix longispora]|uniref:cytochrome P450 n=1 Tax=Saccharothrix longispora TaxID=33920 RepID=UPI0028FD25B3|nr:cytochrome P450 [Saccharothrix longispora]MDU0292829.1 cytochrome P450 [Saccharothrix longispora]
MPLPSPDLVRPAPFTVPRLRLPFDAPPTRPDAEPLRARAIRWGERHGLIGPRGSARLAGTSLLGLGVALAGTATGAGASVVVDWFLWAVVLDDRVDDGPWAEDGVLDRFTAAVEAITGGRGGRRADDPMLAALADDLWPRTVALGDEAWVERLRGHLLRHLDAQRELVRARVTAADVGVEDYVRVRRHAFGALVFFDLIEAGDGAAHPVAACRSGCRDALRERAADVVSWTNDIHSVAKDAVLGERFNLVTVLARERALGVRDAVDAAHGMLVAAVADFTAVKRRHATCGSRVAERLEQVMGACAEWHRTASRYHLRAGGHASAHTGEVTPTLKSRQFEVDPHPLYALLRTTRPVAYDEPTDTWLLSRYADVRAALTDPRFTNANYGWQIAPLLGHSIVSMDGREHAAHRALLTPAFRSRALALIQASITEVATSLVGHLRGHDRADLVTAFATPLPIKVIARVLGLPADTPEQVDRVRAWTGVGFSYLANYRQDPGLLTRGPANRDDFYDYLQPHLDARRARPAGDLISAMLASTVDGRPLSDEYVRGCCAVLLTAGSETSTAGLANLVVNALDEPGVRDAVRRDPAAADRALAETLRRDAPMQLVLRQTSEAVELPSGAVPAHATVACLIGSANRDPERFDRPDDFDLDRADGVDREYSAASSHLSFGAGRHYCLGAHLARAELTTGLRVLLDAFPGLRRPPGPAPAPTGFVKRCPPRLDVLL